MSGEASEIAVKGFFTAIGHEPATQAFRGQVERTARGTYFRRSTR
jgi:thioredoxin reductase